MKNYFMYFVMVLSVLCIGFSACSKGEDVESEKGEIEKITEQIAEDAVQGIKVPINKARVVQDREGKRQEDLDNLLDEQ
ncbi:MAG: hypothetical protein JRI87_05790 [Deltaproteobacteria bacterium]|nr:hypothetical protein [Deltaproteobacteria bacterium]